MPTLAAKPEDVRDLLATLPEYWWSVDPGDVNVGVSWWSGSVCFRSYHTTQEDCVDTLVYEASHGLELLVHETFSLRGYQMGMQQGSEFLTSQLIGAMRHVCRRAGVPVLKYQAGNHKPAIVNSREHKPPNRAHTEWRSYGNGPHAKDSESLGEYYVYRTVMKGRGY